MKKKWRHWVLCAVLAVGSALGAYLLSDVRFFQILNLKAYDAHFVVRDWLHGRPAISNIVLLLNDHKTRDTFREPLLFWQRHYANAIRAAGQAGAQVIGLDLAFGLPVAEYKPDYDRELGEAVSTLPVPVVCGYATELNTNPDAQTVPINMLSAALGLAGFVNITSDADDFARRQELVEAPPGNAHSLALRVAENSWAAMRNGRTENWFFKATSFRLRPNAASTSITPDRRILFPACCWRISSLQRKPEISSSFENG